MKSTLPNEKEEEKRPLSSVILEVFKSLQNLIRSEINLTRTELKSTLKKTGKDTALAVLFGTIALIGILPFVAFLVIGLGKLINNNYWLSSLIIGVVFIGIGAILGFYFGKKLTDQDLSLPHSRESFQNEAEMMKMKLNEVKDVTQRRAS